MALEFVSRSLGPMSSIRPSQTKNSRTIALDEPAAKTSLLPLAVSELTAALARRAAIEIDVRFPRV